MEIYISEEAIIADIQRAFQEAYPCLKLEFYQQPHEIGQASRIEQRIIPDTPIEDIRMMHTFGWIDISPQRTAADLEHDLRRRFGLSAQVLRRSGSLWLETTRTDHWTLAQLNEAGRALKATAAGQP